MAIKIPEGTLTEPQILDIAKRLREQAEDFPTIGTPEALASLDAYGQKLKDSTASAAALSDELRTLNSQLVEVSKHIDDGKVSLRGLDLQAELLITRLTGVRKATNATFIESFSQAVKNSEKFSDVLGQLAETSKETLTGFNIGVATLRKFTEGSVNLTKEIDVATSAFAKATGTGNQYKGMLKASEFQNRRLGVTMGEQTAALQAMMGGFSEFLLISPEMQELLLQETTQFERFGVAAATTTKFLQNVTRTTKLSIPQARRLQKTIMGVANAFGDDLNKVLEETSDVIPQLAIYGQRLESVLKDVYAASKRTGMGMSDIVSFGTQFDTFESAAQAAGSLNAVLGQMGGRPLIDTMEILRTIEEGGPAAAMELFQSSIEQSVGSFENLGYWQQNAIANALGMSVEQTRMMMLQEEQTSKMEAAMNKVGLGQTQMNKLLAEGRDLWTELQILVMQFAVSLEKPLIGLKKLVGFMNTMLGGLGPVGKTIGAVGGSLLSMGLFKKLFLRGTFIQPMWVNIKTAGAGFFSKLLAPRGAYAGGSWLAPGVQGFGGGTGGAAAPKAGGMLGGFGKAMLPFAAAAVGVWAAIKAVEKIIGEKDKGKQTKRIIGAISGAIIGALAIGLAPVTGGASLLLGVGAAGSLAYGGQALLGSFHSGTGNTTVPQDGNYKLAKGEEVRTATQARADLGVTRTNELLETVAERLSTLTTATESAGQSQRGYFTHEQMEKEVKRALSVIPSVRAV